MKELDVAIVGAGAPVGEALLELLEERDFPVRQLFLLDAGENVGSRPSFRGSRIPVKPVSEFDFSGVRLVFFAADADFIPQARQAAEAGCIVIDCSGALSGGDCPVIVAEANPSALAGVKGGGIVAVPAPSAVAIAAALKPLADIAGLEAVDVVSLRAVSARGKPGIEALASQTAKLLNAMPVEEEVFSRQIAFNVLPEPGPEPELARELREVLTAPDLVVNAVAVTVPVFFGHCEVVHIETRDALTPEAAMARLATADGIELQDVAEGPTPVTDAARGDVVYVGRITRDPGRERGLNLWLVADNVRRGGAGNSVRIAEILVRDYL